MLHHRHVRFSLSKRAWPPLRARARQRINPRNRFAVASSRDCPAYFWRVIQTDTVARGNKRRRQITSELDFLGYRRRAGPLGSIHRNQSYPVGFLARSTVQTHEIVLRPGSLLVASAQRAGAIGRRLGAIFGPTRKCPRWHRAGTPALCGRFLVHRAVPTERICTDLDPTEPN
jgi:hypothetical protein